MSQFVHVALDFRHKTAPLDARTLSRSLFTLTQQAGAHFSLPSTARSPFETEFIPAADRAWKTPGALLDSAQRAPQARRHRQDHP
ncbi:hypothetical protein [Streptomyces fulvoviolaceus]|uniref:hypothetical protein n=1 Tax=Streptomyces fulvoviolaceus TaxID=285535 RepID=UPI00131DEC5A|nr:hypothetical protein [Streptomyces fulvoviolaceus]MCT9077894.1 hypothetical protein [Streptomyces fulvoviolaceus]